MSRRNKTKPNNTQEATTDAFSNQLFRLGYGSQSPLEATEYPLTRMTDNYARLNALYRDNWLVQNVVGIVPDDMTRKWVTVNGSVSPEQLARLEKAQRVSGVKDKINTGLKWGRLYGGAAGLIMIRGQEGMMDRPLDPDLIYPGSFAGIYLIDRWCGVTPGVELVQDMADPEFGLPDYYNINSPDNRLVMRVHHSRVLRFTGRELPYLERLAEMYWGASEVESIYSEVVKHDNVAANMAALTFQANLHTMEVQNLDQLFSLSPAEQQRRFWNTLQAQSVVRSNFGTQLVNKGDSITQHQYTFAGLADVYNSICMDVAGASHIPLTKLFGRSPSGLNATGESDLQNYYDYIDSLREQKLRPLLDKLLPVMAMSTWGAIPDDLDISFPPMWTPDAKEEAEIAKAKTESIINAFQAGLLDLATAQKELKRLSAVTGMFDSLTDEQISANAGKTFQDVTALRDPMAGLGYGGDDTGPFEVTVGDSLTLDYPGQPREKDGRYTYGKMLKSEAGNGIVKLPNGKKKERTYNPADYQNLEVGNAENTQRKEAGGFKDKEKLKDHVARHGKAVGAKNEREYERKAVEFMSKPLGENMEEMMVDGKRYRYDYSTNEFGVVNPGGDVSTYFKPDKNENFWEGEIRKHGKKN